MQRANKRNSFLWNRLVFLGDNLHTCSTTFSVVCVCMFVVLELGGGVGKDCEDGISGL